MVPIEKYPLPISTAIFFTVCYILGLTNRSLSTRLPLLVLMTATGVYISFYTTTGNRGYDYLLAGSTVVQMVLASDYMIISDTHRELRLVGQKQGSVADLPFLERLRWAINLYCTSRGIGWAHQPSHLPKARPSQSRRGFLFEQSLWALSKFLIFDTFTYINKIYPPYQVIKAGLVWRCLNIFMLVVPAFSFLELMYGLASLVAVSCCLSEPEQWPPLFGNWFDAYTVRRLWSVTWHQLLRRPFTTYGKFFAFKVFRLQRGSILSALVQLFTAFIVSGFVHQMADYSLLGNLYEGGSFAFFLLQPFAIIFEELVIHLAEKVGMNPPWIVSRLVGYIWVLSWFAFCVPIMQLPMIRGGISSIGPDLHLAQYVVSR